MSSITKVERQARREADRHKSRAAVERLADSDGWKAWLAARRHFHRYSLVNQALIAAQRPGATCVTGFRAWLQLGYAVRRGERSLQIWVPMPPSKRAMQQWRQDVADPDERPKTWFKLAAVFDRSQVDPLPPPTQPAPLDLPISPAEGCDLAWAFLPLARLAQELGCTVIREDQPAKFDGCFVPATNTIAINKRRAINHQVATLVHETSHALVRSERDEEDPVFGYSAEELVVESITYTVCGSLGLDTSNYSIPYLASWAQSAPLSTIETAARTIDRIAKRIELAVIPTE